ncbi:MAG: hypothetical protein ACT4OW_02690 [Nitrososphaerota archaeon]
MQMAELAQKNILDQILKIDEELIRFAGIIDTGENTLISKSQKNKQSYVTEKEEEEFALDLENIRKLQDKFNDRLGSTVFTHVMRKRLHQFIYYLDNLIVYVTCEPMIDQKLISKISSDIELTIKYALSRK